MKKVLVVALSALIALSFCAVASADLVGHVGHIDKSSYVTVDTGDIVCTPSYDGCVCIDLSNVNVDESNVNMDGEGTWTLTLLSGVSLRYYSISGQLLVDVSDTGLDPDGILIRNTSGTYDYYPVVGGVATIPDASGYFEVMAPSGAEMQPSVSQMSTEVYLVAAESDTTGGGGGGGCSVSAFSPLMALLLAPLMLLKK